MSEPNLLTALGDAIPHGLILVANEDERILYANRAAGNLLGVDSTYLVGDRATRMYGSAELFQQLHDELASVGSVIDRATQLHRHDGSPFSGILSLCAVADHPLVMMTFTRAQNYVTNPFKRSS